MITTQPISQTSRSGLSSSVFSVAGGVGFYFAFRASITFLLFQSEPQTGAAVSIALNLLLLIPLAFTAFGPTYLTLPGAVKVWPFRLVLLFLALSFVSLAWTEAQSPSVAMAYWSGLPADVALVLLALRAKPAGHALESIFKGFVCGVLLLSLIAWIAPAQADLRIGNDDFLSPNVIGFECAFAALLCHSLAHEGARWTWAGVALAVTLLRSLSKTSILAFLAAEVFYLLKNRTITRAAKMALFAGAALAFALFSSLIVSYYQNYINAGTQAETLTGRTGIWIATLAIALEKPWIGHGFHSFHNVVPAFGDYQAWHAHNEFLQQFFSYGLLGVVLVAALYSSLILQIRRSADHPLALLTQALLLLVLIRGLVDTERFDLSFPLWAMTAISLTLAQAMTQSQEAFA